MSKQKSILITGTSRGLGLECAARFLSQGYPVFGVSRNFPKDSRLGKNYHHFSCDLTHPEGLEKILCELEGKTILKAIVNNAGMLDPMLPLLKCDLEDLRKHLLVNLLAPMVLIRLFAHLLDSQSFTHIINISSGAAKTPYPAWGPYGAAKAGLEQLTRVLALELPDQVEVLSFAPGVVDTSMQEQIRNAELENFPKKEKFVLLKEEGKLLAPEIPARAICWLATRENKDFHGQVLDFRDPEFQKRYGEESAAVLNYRNL